MAQSQQTLLECLNDVFCQPCSTENVNIEAAVYCQQCREYLCDNCCRCHRKSAASNSHILVEITAIPETQTPIVMDELTDTCPNHEGKVLEYFCHTHGEICCSGCLTMVHSSCENKSYVTDVSKGTATGREYENLIETLEKLFDFASTGSLINVENDQANAKCRIQALQHIRRGRKILDKILNTIVKESVKNVNRLHEENSDKIKTAKQTFESVLADIKATTTNLDDKAKASKNIQLFVEMKLTRNRIPAIQNAIKDAIHPKMSCYTFYSFDQGERVQATVSALSSVWSMHMRPLSSAWATQGRNDVTVKQWDGDVEARGQHDVSVESARDTKVKFLQEFTVKSKEDREDRFIIGIAVMDRDRVVAADSDNVAVKLVSVRLNKVISRLTLTSDPWDVTKMTPDQVAVALYVEQKIEIITMTDDVISKSRTVHVPGDDFISLCYTGEVFILGYKIALKIVDMSGTVRYTYTCSQTDPAFQYPRYIAFSRDHNVLYISDTEQDDNTVTTMTSRGEIASVYRSDLLTLPAGVTVGWDGNVYVCSWVTNTVLQLTATGDQAKVFLDRRRGLATQPWAIACDDDRLYISSDFPMPKYCNNVKVFQLE